MNIRVRIMHVAEVHSLKKETHYCNTVCTVHCMKTNLYKQIYEYSINDKHQHTHFFTFKTVLV